MKKIIAWLLVVALTAAISIGATLAYLTDTDEDVNVMTLGKVKIDQLEYERVDVESKNDDATVQEFHDNKPLLPAVTDKDFDYTPGDTYVDWDQIGKDGYTSEIWNPEKINNEVDKMVFIKNKGDYDAFVRSIFAFEAGKYTTLNEFRKMVHLNLNETDFTWEWVANPVTIGESTYFVATATYKDILAPGALTKISMSQVALDKTATNEDVEAFGDTYQILVKSQGIQAAGFEDPSAALDEGFGVVTETTIPWESDVPTKGIDVKTALHYLDGDTTTDAITAKVKTVTFGLNKEYAAIADGYDGTLVDVEQDVPVYAYYVPNGSNYDVYLLADDDIYLPKDSSTLMMDMKELTTVNCDNLNTSRTVNMKQAFLRCGKLTSLDTTDWDVSNVESLNQTFSQCAKLPTLDTTNWDISSLQSLYYTFYQCYALTSLPGIEDWDTGSLTTVRGAFRQTALKGDFDLTGWDTSNIQDMGQLFYKCANITGFNGAGWDTSNTTDMFTMFYDCTNVQTLNLTGWDTSDVVSATGMFTRCKALTSIVGSGKLDFGKVTDMQSMLENCLSLTYLDVSNWDCGSCTGMLQVFAWTKKLERIDGLNNWNVSNVTTMMNMFYQCFALKEVDLSNWRPSAVTDISGMFYQCSALTSANLNGWTLDKMTTVSHMFADCGNLATLTMDNWYTPSMVVMDAMLNDCDALVTVDVSSFNTANVNEMSQVFEGCKSLKQIIGLNNWNTEKVGTFGEMFSGCNSLEELDLSSFNTKAARNGFVDSHNKKVNAYTSTFAGVNSLQKLVVSGNITYLGNGSVTEATKLAFPAPAAKAGFTAMWRNAETGELYLAKDIPELTAATYEAYYQPIATN